MLCKVCKGSGNLVTFNPISYWNCPACGGAGVTVMFGPPSIKIHKLQFDKWRKQAMKIARSQFKEPGKCGV